MLAPTTLSFESIIDRVRSHEPFSFVRYGDGEWLLIMDHSPRLLQVIRETDDQVCEDLADTLRHWNGAVLGMQGTQDGSYLVRKNLWSRVGAWITANHLDLPWVWADVLHTASMNNRLGTLVDALRERQVTLVGPAYLSSLPFYHRHLVTDEFSAHKQVDNLYQELKDLPATAIVFCCSIAAKILIHRLHGRGHLLLDCGSVFDPYAGVLSRKYMRTPAFLKVLDQSRSESPIITLG
jgi:hypothetical protein